MQTRNPPPVRDSRNFQPCAKAERGRPGKQASVREPHPSTERSLLARPAGFMHLTLGTQPAGRSHWRGRTTPCMWHGPGLPLAASGVTPPDVTHAPAHLPRGLLAVWLQTRTPRRRPQPCPASGRRPGPAPLCSAFPESRFAPGRPRGPCRWVSSGVRCARISDLVLRTSRGRNAAEQLRERQTLRGCHRASSAR